MAGLLLSKLVKIGFNRRSVFATKQLRTLKAIDKLTRELFVLNISVKGIDQ
jgi:hypothetical protein